ncbi:MAG: lipocalin family protein [Saprospiraceae bacterium]
MKTTIFIGLALFVTLLMACKKDPEISNCAKLEGIWQCESWKEDTIQFLGATLAITASELTFKVLTGDQGDYEWNTDNLIGAQNMIIGSYVVNTDCDQVNLTPKGGTAYDTYDFHFDGDVLVMEGTINSVLRELQLRRK